MIHVRDGGSRLKAVSVSLLPIRASADDAWSIIVRVVARCGARHPAMADTAVRPAEGGKLRTRSDGT